MEVLVEPEEPRTAAVVVLRRAPGVVLHKGLVAGVTVEGGTQAHRIALEGLVEAHRGIVEDAVARERRMTAAGDTGPVEGVGKVLQIAVVGEIDLEEGRRRIVDKRREDLEEGHHMPADAVADNLGVVVGSSPGADHSLVEAQEERRAVVGTPAVGIDLVGVADSLAEESLCDYEQSRAFTKTGALTWRRSSIRWVAAPLRWRVCHG